MSDIKLSSSNKIESIVNLRGLAICTVLVSHFGAVWNNLLGPLSYFLLSGVGTVYFVFISGLLCGYMKLKGRDSTEYTVIRIVAVLKPYLVFSTIPVIYGIITHRSDSFDYGIPEYVIWSLYVGGSIVRPYWYLPAAMMMYLFTPIVVKAAGKNISAIGIVVGGFVLFLVTNRPPLAIGPMQNFLHYIGVFSAGIAIGLRPTWLELSDNKKTIFLTVSGAVITLVAWFSWDKHFDEVSHEYFLTTTGWNNIGKLGLFLFLTSIVVGWFRKSNNVTEYLANRSFSLFFLHALFVPVSFKIYQIFGLSVLNYVLLDIFFLIIVPLALSEIILKIFGKDTAKTWFGVVS